MIRLIWPTVRPAVAAKNALDWLEKSTSKDADICIEFGVNSDSHEDEMGHLASKIPTPYIVLPYKNARPGITHTATLMTWPCDKVEDRDIFILTSDDFSCSPGWDEHLKNQYSFAWDGALIVNDCYPKETNIIPLPVVSGAVLKRLNGILYHPIYNHFFSDQELFYICQEVGLIKNLRGTDAPKFKHEHWSFGGRQKDQFDLRNNTKWAEDQATYEKRKSLSVEEKLKLPEWF